MVLISRLGNMVPQESEALILVSFPFSNEEMNIDVDGAVKLIRQVKPKLALCGQSVFLFPTPLKAIAEAAHEVGAYRRL